MNLYLIPTVSTGTRNRGKEVYIEYKLVYRKTDLRSQFCREHKENIVNPLKLLNVAQSFKVSIKGDRFILPNGTAAHLFNKIKDIPGGIKFI